MEDTADMGSWTIIDELEMRALPNINDQDLCFYYLNRTSGGFSASVANDLIDDFKKDVARFRNNSYVMGYKQRAIKTIAEALSNFVVDTLGSALAAGQSVSLVPMPTSLPPDHPDYDDRLVRLCELASNHDGVRVDDVLHARAAMVKSHLGGTRVPEIIARNIEFDGFPTAPDYAILVDDVLTTGAHYAACRDIIRRSPKNRPAALIGAFLCIHRSDYVNYEDYGIPTDKWRP